MRKRSLDVDTMCEPFKALLDGPFSIRNISFEKLKTLVTVAPTCSSFDEMLEKLFPKEPKKGSYDEMYKKALMDNKDAFVFGSKRACRGEVVELEIVPGHDFEDFCIIRKPRDKHQKEIERGINKLIQDAKLPQGSMVKPDGWLPSPWVNWATWYAETFLFVGKKTSPEENSKIVKAWQIEMEFHVITEIHAGYDDDDNSPRHISKGDLELKIVKKKTLYHPAVANKMFTLYHVKGSLPWKLYRADTCVDIFKHNNFNFTDKEYPGMAKLTKGPLISCCKYKMKKWRSVDSEILPIEEEPAIPEGFSTSKPFEI